MPKSKPGLLVAIYANPDLYPPIINASRILSRSFQIRIIARNTVGIPSQWPDDVTIERLGSRATEHEQQRAGASRKALDFARFVWALRRAIAEADPCAIYAYDPMAFSAAIFLAGQNISRPVIFHCHDTPTLENLPAFSMQSWAFRYALSHTKDAAFVVFPEQHRAEYWLERAKDNRKPMIVPNGADRDFFQLDSNLNDLFARRFAIRRALYMGWLGMEHAELNAVHSISMAPGCTLTLLGTPSGQLRAALENVLKADGTKEIVHTCPWDAVDRREVMLTSTLGLVLYRATSVNWDYSASAVNKLFEYAAAGLPVVVPDRRSYREFLGDEEWIAFADVDDPRSIARAMEWILADPNRYATMSKAALHAHQLRLNYQHLFEPVYRRLMAL